MPAWTIVELLVENGACINATYSNGHTALTLASQNGHPEVVQFLIGNGAEVNATLGDGCTALKLASGNGHKEVVKLLQVAQGAENACIIL